MTASISIVIVNWNSGTFLRRCLLSIRDALSVARASVVDSIIIIDNASTDGSADVGDLPSELPLRIITNVRNRGFAAACNQGAALSKSGQLLFLNTDVAVRSDTLETASQYLEANAGADVGILGIRLEDEAGQTQRCTSRFPTPGRLFAQSCGLDRIVRGLGHFDTTRDHSVTRNVDQVMGAFLLVRRDLFERLVGFDERFFVYFDDVDFCFRARNAGAQSVFFAGASALHTGEATTRGVKDARLFYLLRSRLLYAQKHFRPVGQVVTALGTLVVEPVSRAALLATRAAWSDLTSLARAYRQLYLCLPRLGDPDARAKPWLDRGARSRETKA